MIGARMRHPALVKAYVDDSRQENCFWALGCYAGNSFQWEDFEPIWSAMLKKHGVPYFHMRELGSPTGVYRKWWPPQEHEVERKAFFEDVTRIICDCYLRGFWSITRIGDLSRFNSENGLSLDPYSLAAYGLLLVLATEYGNIDVDVVFDNVEKVNYKLALTCTYAKSDLYHHGVCDKIITRPLGKKDTFRNILPLQSADFLVGELQKSHQKVEPWFDEGRPNAIEEWSMEKFGIERPPARKSLEAVMIGGAPAGGLVWDYKNLTQAHHHRNGVWSLP